MFGAFPVPMNRGTTGRNIQETPFRNLEFLNLLTPQERLQVEKSIRDFEAEQRRLSVLRHRFWEEAELGEDRSRSGLYNRVVQEIGNQEKNLIQLYRNWISELEKATLRPPIEVQPSQRLTLGGGGLFRNLTTRFVPRTIPQLNIPRYEPPVPVPKRETLLWKDIF